MRKLETLFKEFINAPIQIYSGATFKKGLQSLLDVYDNTVSGDLVVVKSGTYAIGDNYIHLKDNVNWQFVGTPTITSISSDATFYDNYDDVVCSFSGNVNIFNTTSGKPNILLQGDSKILGFKNIFKVQFVVITGGSQFNLSVLENNCIPDLDELTLSVNADKKSFTLSAPYQAFEISPSKRYPHDGSPIYVFNPNGITVGYVVSSISLMGSPGSFSDTLLVSLYNLSSVATAFNAETFIIDILDFHNRQGSDISATA